MNIKRRITIFISDYGRLIFLIIVFIVSFVYIIKSFNQYVRRINEKKGITPESKIEVQKQIEIETEEKKCISEFLDYCKTNKYEDAYEMLSDDCKKQRYNTINIFIENFVKKYFDIAIISSKFSKENNIYNITLKQDMLITGKTNSTKSIKIEVDKSNNKIFIYNDI